MYGTYFEVLLSFPTPPSHLHVGLSVGRPPCCHEPLSCRDNTEKHVLGGYENLSYNCTIVKNAEPDGFLLVKSAKGAGLLCTYASMNGDNMSSVVGAASRQPGKPARLERLLPETMLQIVTNLPGLDTLWNLMRASAYAWRLFSKYALPITNGILSGHNSILSPGIQELVRGVILARSACLPFQSLAELQFFIRSHIPPALRTDNSPMSLGPDVLLASVAPVTVLRSVVATSCQISALSQACLASCLARLRDPSFRPLHAFNPEPRYTHGYSPNDEWVPAWDREFVGTPVKVVDAGQPT
jgi:hypothetical protein